MRFTLILLYLIVSSGFVAVAQGGVDSISISAIDIVGNKITRERVILRELPIAAGQQIPRNAIDEYVALTRLRLLNAGLFTSVNVQTQITEDGNVQFEIEVKERFYIMPKPIFQLADRNFNVWWEEMHRDIRRINAGVKLTNNNFRGNFESFSVTVQAGYTQKLAVEYIRPYLDKTQKHGLGFSAGVTQSGELSYKTDSNKLCFARLTGSYISRQYDANVSWFYRPQFAVRHTLTLGYHYGAVSDTIIRLNTDYFGDSRNRLQYADLIYRIDYNGVDNWNYPLRGFKSVNYLVLRKGIEGLGYQAQWKTETGVFAQLKPKWYGQAILRGRLSVPNEMPYFFQSALGTKTDYVRGYERYVIDGIHYGLVRFDLKRELCNTTFRKLPFRYLPELPVRIYPKIFADAGISHNPYPGNSVLHDRMLYSGGIGLDIVTAYDFKLRVEAAVNHLGQYGLYLHLNSE